MIVLMTVVAVATVSVAFTAASQSAVNIAIRDDPLTGRRLLGVSAARTVVLDDFADHTATNDPTLTMPTSSTPARPLSSDVQSESEARAAAQRLKVINFVSRRDYVAAIERRKNAEAKASNATPVQVAERKEQAKLVLALRMLERAQQQAREGGNQRPR